MDNTKTQQELYAVLRQDYDEWKNLTDLAEYALLEIETKFQIFRKYMDSFGKNPIEHIKKRVKKFDSTKEKLERKGYAVNIENARNHIYDLAGLRIICPFESDISVVKNYLKKLESEGSLKIIEVKDYITNPKPNGYRSFHVIVQVPVKLSDCTEWMYVEIQLRTVAMDFWACLEHKIFYKQGRIADSDITDRLKKCSEMIDLLDKEMYDIHQTLLLENDEK